jgi:hypothetical protein
MARRTSQSVLAALASALLLGADGCFDVRMVDPGPLIIDDFDDGDFLPSDPAFSPWFCFAFNPAKSTGFKCDHDAGYKSTYSLFLQATIDDPPDGVQQNGGAALQTYTVSGQDFSKFRHMVFSAELESGSPPLPSNAQLEVEIGCSTELGLDGRILSNFQVVQNIDYQSFWQTHTLEMGDFSVPSYLSNTNVMGGATSCLQRVDSIHFAVNANLPDGQSGSFTLHVDDIFFE